MSISQGLMGTHDAALWVQGELKAMAQQVGQDSRLIHVSNQFIRYHHYKKANDPHGLHLPAEHVGRDLLFTKTALAAWFGHYVTYIRTVKPRRSITGAGFLRNWKGWDGIADIK